MSSTNLAESQQASLLSRLLTHSSSHDATSDPASAKASNVADSNPSSQSPQDSVIPDSRTGETDLAHNQVNRNSRTGIATPHLPQIKPNGGSSRPGSVRGITQTGGPKSLKLPERNPVHISQDASRTADGIPPGFTPKNQPAIELLRSLHPETADVELLDPPPESLFGQDETAGADEWSQSKPGLLTKQTSNSVPLNPFAEHQSPPVHSAQPVAMQSTTLKPTGEEPASSPVTVDWGDQFVWKALPASASTPEPAHNAQ